MENSVQAFVLGLGSSSFHVTRRGLTSAVRLPGTYSIWLSLPLVDDMGYQDKSEPPSPIKGKSFVSWNMKDDGEGVFLAP